MPSEAKRKEIVRLFEQALKAWRFRKKRKLLLHKLYEVADNSEEFRHGLTYSDIVDIYQTGVMGDQLLLASSEQIEYFVNSNLFTPKKFHYYYPIYYTYNYPNNLRIGHCVAKTFVNLPKEIQDHFVDHWSDQFDNNKGVFRKLDGYIKNRKESLFLYIATEAYGDDKCREIAQSLVDRSLDMLRMIYRHDVIVQEYCRARDRGYFVGMGGYRYDERPPNHEGVWSFQPVMQKEIEDLSDLLLSKQAQKGKIEVYQKLNNALHLIGAATSARYNEVKYVLLCSALESMLLTSSDKDYLGLRLAERVAFLTQKPAKRQQTFKQISEIYGKRSRIVHQDKDKPMSLSDAEIWQLDGIVQNVFWRLVELKKKGYIYFAENEHSVINYLDSLKFRGRK